MKRFCLIILLILVALCAYGCADDSQPASAPSPSPTPVPTPEQPVVTVTPTPAPTPTPFPRVAIDDYVLIWKNDTSRGINYQIPTHWKLVDSGDRYLVYEEPVPENETGFRVAFANKKVSGEPDSSAMKKQLNTLLECMKEQYADFAYESPISRQISLVRFKGYSVYYNYTAADKTPMRGFVIIATYNRRIYCMNWSGPLDRFNDMQTVGAKVLESVSRVSTTNR